MIKMVSEFANGFPQHFLQKYAAFHKLKNSNILKSHCKYKDRRLGRECTKVAMLFLLFAGSLSLFKTKFS